MYPQLLGRGQSFTKTARIQNSEWREAALSLEKKASLSAAVAANATRILAPKSDVFVASKTPWLASKFLNRARRMRRGAGKNTRGMVQSFAEDFGLAPEAAHLHAGVGLLQDAAMRVKAKHGTGFMHTPERLETLNRNLSRGKKNLLKLKKQIKDAKAEGRAEDVVTKSGLVIPGWKSLNAERKREAGTFKQFYRELNKEKQVGSLPMSDVLDEMERGAYELGKKSGMGPAELAGAGAAGRAKLDDMLLAAGIDPAKTTLRQAQDRLVRFSEKSEADRIAKADAKRSDFGKMLARAGRFIYDPDKTSSEVSAKLIGSMQLDDVYDPIARNRSTADNIFKAQATEALAGLGDSVYGGVIEPLEQKYGPAAAKKLTELRESVLEYDPMETARDAAKALGMSTEVKPPPSYIPPTPKVLSNSEKRRIKKLKRRGKKKRRR